MIETSRRGLLTGLSALVAAPAIVRASSLMPVKALQNVVPKRIVSVDFAGGGFIVCECELLSTGATRVSYVNFSNQTIGFVKVDSATIRP